MQKFKFGQETPNICLNFRYKLYSTQVCKFSNTHRVKNKLKEWLSDDLKKWDISRDAPYFGFKIPDETEKYFYVWVDAPIGYLASISNWAKKNNLDMNDLWSQKSDYEIHHFIGKDIAYFHGLFWPALLSSANYKLPDSINVHGCLLYTSPSPRDKRQSRMPSSA